MTLEKAELYSLDGRDYDFKFMYNPKSLSISRKVNVSENKGTSTKGQGIPKVSFGYPNAMTISIKGIIFDSYEDSSDRDVGNKLQKLTQTIKFIKAKRRPPVYVFSWGKIHYLRCYVESLDYQLTLFLPDGTPVRATADIRLKEVDPYKSLSNPPPKSDRKIDTRW